MAKVVILVHDWDSGGGDRVPYHSQDPDGCLDLDSSPMKPRAALTEIARKTMHDCNSSSVYNVVVCEVSEE